MPGADPLVAEDLDRTLADSGCGSRADLAEMIDRLYDAVRRISGAEMRRAFGGRAVDGLTLGPTAIANDAMLRVLRQRSAVADDGQFFALAARFIRQLVVDYQRRRLAAKRGGGDRGVGVDALIDAGGEPADPRAVDPADEQGDDATVALDALADAYPRKAEVVALHVVGGMAFPAVAGRLGVSLATVERDWAFAKAWLADRLRKES